MTIYRAEYVLPISGEPIPNGEVLVEGERIREVGPGIAERHPDAAVRDLGRAVLLPGFVNTHSHLEYTLSRNRYDALNLWDWINNVGFRRGQTPDPTLMLASARAGAAMCARSGMTCLGDSSFSGIAAQAMDEIGQRGIVYKELFGQSMGDGYLDRFAYVVDGVAELQQKVSSRLKIGLSPHTVYTTGVDVLKLCAQTCATLDTPVAIHLGETRTEADYTVHGKGPIADWRREIGYEPMVSGLRPARVLEKAGLLRRGVCLAHCVDLTQDEVELIGASGASVAHCPRSNGMLGAGAAPVVALREAGAVVGLGTDSAGSCGDLDFFEEMRSALRMHRAAAEDAGVLTAKDVLKMATADGAAALGVNDVGALEPGMRADMIAVDMGDMLPGEDLHLAVLSRSPKDVTMTMVDGNVILTDVDERMRELREAMERSGIA